MIRSVSCQLIIVKTILRHKRKLRRPPPTLKNALAIDWEFTLYYASTFRGQTERHPGSSAREYRLAPQDQKASGKGRWLRPSG